MSGDFYKFEAKVINFYTNILLDDVFLIFFRIFFYKEHYFCDYQ